MRCEALWLGNWTTLCPHTRSGISQECKLLKRISKQSNAIKQPIVKWKD